MNRFYRSLLLFCLYAFLAFAIEVLPVVDRVFVQPFIAKITALSGALIGLFGGSATVTYDVLQSTSTGFAVRVDNGCSGLEAVILICAAVLSFPASWWFRLVGVVSCSVAIVALNVVRIISLFYLGQVSKEWFEWAHIYAWDVLIMIDGLVALMLWIRFVRLKSASVY